MHNLYTNSALYHFTHHTPLYIFHPFEVGRKRSDVVFSMSYVVFSTSDIFFLNARNNGAPPNFNNLAVKFNLTITQTQQSHRHCFHTGTRIVLCLYYMFIPYVFFSSAITNVLSMESMDSIRPNTFITKLWYDAMLLALTLSK